MSPATSTGLGRHLPAAWKLGVGIGAAVLATWVVRPTDRPDDRPPAPPPGHAVKVAARPSPAPETQRPLTARSEDEACWRKLWSRAPGPERDAELKAILAKLGAVDPMAALEMMLDASNPVPLSEQLPIILQAWAGVAPEAAAGWALALPAEDREAAVAAVLAGSTLSPEEQAQLAWRICAADPELAFEHGNAAISTLARRGEFGATVRFALLAGAGAEGESGVKWLNAAFAGWAQRDPWLAVSMAAALPEGAARNEAMLAVTQNWALAAPADSAAFAWNLPAGPERSLLLNETLGRWVARDPVAATGWIGRLDPAPELDNVTASVALMPQFADHRPEVAVSWAESIVDARLRNFAVGEVVRRWAKADAAAARRYVETSAALGPDGP